MKMEARIKSFTDIKIWQKAHKLGLLVYKLVKQFPKDERFSLTSQVKRAVISVTPHIAEGFSRETFLDNNHFYIMTHGSLAEVQNQLLLARDVKYGEAVDFKKFADQSVVVSKLLSGLIRSTKDKANSQASRFELQAFATERSM